MVPTSSRPARWKERGRKAPMSASVPRESFIISLYLPDPACALRVTNESPSHMTEVLCKLLHICQDWRQWACEQALQLQSLGFLQSSESPHHKPCWFSKPDVLGAHHPSAGPARWEAQCGTQIPAPRRGPPPVVPMSLPRVRSCAKAVASDYTAPLPWLLVSMRTFFIFLVVKKWYLFY